MGERYDFCGYATKNDLLCADGRTIRKDAFKSCDGKTVPLIWNHRHDDPEMVIGHALLENRPDGVFMYGKLNDSEKGRACKKALENGDLNGLSIWANQLKQKAGDVLHGVIREVSIVLAGANPGALIDFSLSHADDGSDGEVFAYLIGDEYTKLQHGDIEFDETEEEPEEEKEDIKMARKYDDTVLSHAEDDEKEEKPVEKDKKAKTKPAVEDDDDEDDEDEESGETIKDIFNTFTKKQKDAVYAMIGAVVREQKSKDDDDEEDEDDEDDGGKTVRHNAFENEEPINVLSQEVFDDIMRDAKRIGSFREAMHSAMEDGGVLSHSISGPDDYGISRGVAPVSGNKYGMYEAGMLFPDYKAISETPDFIKRGTGWVADFMASVKHVPFARIKSLHADITAEDARALGYIKGNLKKEEFFTLIKRTTDPQTVYKKQKMDRDDIIDITGFDVVAWIRAEMKEMLNEEIARAALLGDGRSTSSPDKISESHIRPIASDADLYSVKVPVAATANTTLAEAFIESAIRARKNYKGSGNPVLYTTEDMLTEMLLLKDGIGHYLYPTVDALSTALRVRKIVAVPVMENATVPITTTTGSSSTTSSQTLYGVIVNLNDYTIGTDRGGQITAFDDFDIDLNQEKYLIETRLSGALTKPYSALVLHAAVA